jgi:hypothetical protein
MLKPCLLLVLTVVSQILFSQSVLSIDESETGRIINVLASDSLEGRGSGQPGLQKAARFIGEEFRKNNLIPLPGSPSYYLAIGQADKTPDSPGLKTLPLLSGVDYNVVGILPGKSKPAEVILFSAHYDHLGIEGSRRRKRIMNGANDNASGTTAIVQLASYFANRNDNERTLIFCAFAGEELGLVGSDDFARYVKPQHIIANINIEMIGVPQYGSKTVFITGDFKSPLAEILQRNTPPADLKYIRDSKPEKRLFERSDNYSFALEGIPTLSLMGSDDDDYCYHKACDDLSRIDIGNMNDIIKAIAKSVSSLVNGTETPERFDIEKYRRMNMD